MPFEELKAKQSTLWGSTPFERVTETIADVHDRLVERLAPGSGERFLDIATGTGPSPPELHAQAPT